MKEISLFDDELSVVIPGARCQVETTHEASREEGDAGLRRLDKFMCNRQKLMVKALMDGEEGQFFIDKMAELASMVETMPVTYQQEGLGEEAVAHLHYFLGDCHWYITEKDKDGEVDQAFGFAILHGDLICAEYGYIPISELVDTGVGAELDFHFKPTPMSQVKQMLEQRYG